MKQYIFTLLLRLFISTTARANGTTVTYQVNGEIFEGYFISSVAQPHSSCSSMTGTD